MRSQTLLKPQEVSCRGENIMYELITVRAQIWSTVIKKCSVEYQYVHVMLGSGSEQIENSWRLIG